MDIGTGLAALGTAQLSKDMLGKMLGPTAEYIGEGVQSWTERRIANVQRVFAKAQARLGDDIDCPGSIPPRVLKAVLEDGQFADDELRAEYLGGVLASSRGENHRDDRAASMAQLVAGLSTYALRTYYIFYSGVRNHEIGKDPRRWRTGEGQNDARIYISQEDYAQAMDFTNEELANYAPILADSLLTLDRQGLIDSWYSGRVEHLQSAVSNRDFPAPGMVITPTQHGIALFSAAHGVRTDPFAAFTDPAAEMFVEDGPTKTNSKMVIDLPT